MVDKTIRNTTSYLTLKRAAQALGVHEQTLRSWEKRGLINMVRLPRSGYRRVPVSEVERLQRVMSAKAPDSQALLVPPRRDQEALARAQAMADAVRAELEGLEASLKFDEFMQQLRGRTWSP